jgi:hypothetical protein
VVLAVAMSGLPAVAVAQQTPQGTSRAPEDVSNARQHFVRGVKMYEEDDFRAALIEFNRAYELAPNWAVLFNIGQSYYQLRDYANALRILEHYVGEGGEKIEKNRRAQVDREIEELRGRVAHVTLKSPVEGADVALDDVPIGKTPFAEPQPIGAGRHRLTISKFGYVTATRVVDIAGGDRLTIDLPIAEEPHAAVAAPPPPSHAPNYTPALLTGTVGGVGIVVGSIFGILAISNKSSLNGDSCQNKLCTGPNAQGDIDALNRNGTISTVAFGVGLVGLGAAVAFYLTERGSGQEPAASDGAKHSAKTFSVEPWLGLGSAGVTGKF